MGLTLFDREGQRLVRNPCGEIIMRRALTVMAERDRAGDEYNALIEERAGRVAIGVIDAPMVTILTDAIAEIQADHPLIDIDILSVSSATLFDSLCTGEIDIMLGRPPGLSRPDRYSYLDIAHEGLTFVARPDLPLVRQRSVPLDTLAMYPWVLQRTGLSLRQGVEHLLQEHKRAMPTRVLNTDSLFMTLSYAARSDAAAVISQPMAHMQAETGQIAILDTAYQVSISSYGILTARNRALPPVASRVLDVLRCHAAV
ncbi:transcriptional regulator [Ameyamaea chiangmaiensis NBRC 103196]|uniref:LysR substrate-binding domain-containing protein n=1 Tax=Ameyamaea chiangmaiensis TaxID=442969 RepID=A0A850PGS8_9PROT|nr:LysR substrate-binding domain-containing protein [Ameyamaea chiangmaiensis]MBS4075620.1 hypothetical protein [Ameyamaea chiangmaiensis]NVN40371.1 hypothetical protein [Ameyamaea chiangmaiensis]GBQ70735.1 transcriptional regulator [Ameyamaea chiangmaiensis NBRC 103196]